MRVHVILVPVQTILTMCISVSRATGLDRRSFRVVRSTVTDRDVSSERSSVYTLHQNYVNAPVQTEYSCVDAQAEAGYPNFKHEVEERFMPSFPKLWRMREGTCLCGYF